MGGHFDIDHERFVMKNRSLASAYERDRGARGQDGSAGNSRQRKQSCFNCKLKKKCPEFKSKRSGQTSGAASFGGEEHLICERYTPAPAGGNRSMSDKQIKSLLKNTKKKF